MWKPKRKLLEPFNHEIRSYLRGYNRFMDHDYAITKIFVRKREKVCKCGQVISKYNPNNKCYCCLATQRKEKYDGIKVYSIGYAKRG